MGQITLGLPIPGQPDSSEETKIPSDFTILQTLLNGNLDRFNLAPGVGSLLLTVRDANYSAVNGDMVLCGQVGTPPFTITAPAPGVGVKFGVIAGFYATGGLPVVIAPHGTEVFGLQGAMGGAAFVTLGTPGSMIVFESAGTGGSWFQIGGQRDTGWVAMPLASGIVSGVGFGGGYAPASRLRGDMVLFRGTILNTSGSPVSVVATLAAPYRPAAFVIVPSASTNVLGITVQTSGNVLFNGNLGAGAFGCFDGTNYSLS